jgi:hypothetical protein
VEAIRGGADMIEVEYDEGYEEVYIRKDNVALGIDGVNASSPEAAFLRKELYGLAKKERRIVVDDKEYELRARTFMTASVRMRSESECENFSLSSPAGCVR